MSVNYPIGDAEVIVLTDAATSTTNITNAKTIIQAAAGGLSQAVTGLSLTADASLMVGAEVVVDIAQDGTARDVSFGSAGDTITAPNLTAVINDRDVISLVWTGTEFAAASVWQKIVDAV
jgi:hypothetical protein